MDQTKKKRGWPPGSLNKNPSKKQKNENQPKQAAGESQASSQPDSQRAPKRGRGCLEKVADANSATQAKLNLKRERVEQADDDDESGIVRPEPRRLKSMKRGPPLARLVIDISSDHSSDKDYEDAGTPAHSPSPKVRKSILRSQSPEYQPDLEELDAEVEEEEPEDVFVETGEKLRTGRPAATRHHYREESELAISTVSRMQLGSLSGGYVRQTEMLGKSSIQNWNQSPTHFSKPTITPKSNMERIGLRLTNESSGTNGHGKTR